MPTDDAGPRPCVGCLDSRACWVCAGTGFLHPIGRRGECSRCGGTGTCSLCAPADEEPAPVVPRQRAATPQPVAR